MATDKTGAQTTVGAEDGKYTIAVARATIPANAVTMMSVLRRRRGEATPGIYLGH